MADEKNATLELSHDELTMLHAAILGPATVLARDATSEDRMMAALACMLATRKLGQTGMIALIEKIEASHRAMHGGEELLNHNLDPSLPCTN
jgi:hypothetical protein